MPPNLDSFPIDAPKLALGTQQNGLAKLRTLGRILSIRSVFGTLLYVSSGIMYELIINLVVGTE